MVKSFYQFTIENALSELYVDYEYMQVDYDTEGISVEDKILVGRNFIGMKKYETRYRNILVNKPFTLTLLNNDRSIAEIHEIYYGIDREDRIIYWRKRFN